MAVLRRRALSLAAALTVVLLSAHALDGNETPRAQLSEAQVKAGLLYNFISFVEWPPSAEGAEFVIGVFGSDPVLLALQTMQGQQYGNRRIEVREIDGPAQARLCRILFVPATRDRQTPALLAALDREPVLTVGEHDQFTRMGGVIRLYPERSRLRLEVDLARAERAQLRISARLLGLARVVKDGHVLR